MSPELIRLAFWLVQVPPKVGTNPDLLLDALKLLVPGVLAYLASRWQAKREAMKAQASIEAATAQRLDAQRDRIVDEWSHLTTQARETVAQAYKDAGDATVARRAAEGRAASLEAELIVLKAKLDAAMGELEELRAQGRRRRTTKGDER